MHSAGAAHMAMVVQAIKASGAIVQVEPEEFRKLLDQVEDGLVVHAHPRMLSPGHKYLMGFKGLVFHASAREPLALPGRCQVVEAKKIWIPG